MASVAEGRQGNSDAAQSRRPVARAEVVHPDERDMLMAQAPEPFFTERHYLIYDIVPARIAFANMPRLAPFIERTWRLIAPKFLVVAHDIRGSVK